MNGNYDLTAMSDGSFGILYSDGQEDYYLLLRPTAEKEELKSVTIAVSPYNRETYSDAAVIFQKRYPQYVINLKDDYDEMSLLKLSDKALKCPPAEEGKALQEGKALCEHEDILALAGVIRLRRRLEANGERAIGLRSMRETLR